MDGSIKALLGEAIAAHQRGNLADAGARYRAVLTIQPNQFDALHMLGVLEAQLGRFADGERLLAQALAVTPDHPGAHLNRGAILEKLNRLEDAVASYDSAIAANAGYLQAHYNRGNALDALGRSIEALASYDRALAINPNFAEAHYNRGNVLQTLRRPAEALDSYGKAVAANPAYAQAYANRGDVLRGLKRFDEALKSYDKALSIAPGHALIYVNRGGVLYELGRYQEAIADYDRAIVLAPNAAPAHANRSAALLRLKQFEGALQSAERAIAIEPQYVEAHCNRGAALRELGRFPEALQSCDRAITLAPDLADGQAQRGDVCLQMKQYEQALASYDRALAIAFGSADSLAGRGRALAGLGRLDEALASCNSALALNPTNKVYLNDRAAVLQKLKRFDEALADYEAAIAADPDFADAHYNIAPLCLRRGDFKRGFKEYEWRWRVERLKLFRGRFATGQSWLGKQDIAGKTVLFYADQGLGDTIQFCRYARLATAAGAKVILQVQKSLVTLLSGMPDVQQVIATGDQPPPFDLYAPLCSLPLAFGTTLPTTPAKTPYLFAPQDRVESWRGQLPRSERLKVGLNWAGNPSYDHDADRSILLPRLLPLLDNEQADFFGLQNGLRDGDEEILRANPGITNLGDQIAPFEDAAAVLASMDLVISSDTAMVHLAGALGRPVWILLPFVPDWRWLLDRDDTPWYPTARLFRQPRAGDWGSVVEEVSRELSRLSKATPV